MKKILKIISIIFLSTFIFNNTYAKEGFISELLDIKTGIEKMDINLATMDNIHFKNSNTQEIFNIFKKTNETLKDKIIKKYENGDFEYYQTKGIIINQKLFVYHTNEYFKYKKLKEKYPNDKEIDNFIMKNYSLMRIYFNRINNLVY